MAAEGLIPYAFITAVTAQRSMRLSQPVAANDEFLSLRDSVLYLPGENPVADDSVDANPEPEEMPPSGSGRSFY